MEALSRSASPEEDDTAAEANEDAVPQLQPTKKGRQSKSTNAAAVPTLSAAAVAAAEALTEGPVSQKLPRRSTGRQAVAPKRRSSAKGKAGKKGENNSKSDYACKEA